MNREYSTSCCGVGNRDAALVSAHDFLHQMQPEPVARFIGFAAVEGMEDMLAIFARNAVTLVSDSHGSACFYSDADYAGAFAMNEGVLHEVGYDTAQCTCLAKYPYGLIRRIQHQIITSG